MSYHPLEVRCPHCGYRYIAAICHVCKKPKPLPHSKGTP